MMTFENRLTEPKGRLTLAYKDLSEIPTGLFVHPTEIRILDLSYNFISYPQPSSLLCNN